ncbi:aminotransferase class IV [Candidatus Harpocratesius sp.]
MNKYSDFIEIVRGIPLNNNRKFSVDIIQQGQILEWIAVVRLLESEGFVIAAITDKFPTGVYCTEGLTAEGNLKGWKLENEKPKEIIVYNIGWPFLSQKPKEPKTNIQGLKVVPHHVMGICFCRDGVWNKPIIIPHGSLSLMIADTTGIQYGQSGFEGCMVSRDENSKIWAYRLDKNATRFDKTSQSLDLPAFDASIHENLMRKVIGFNKDYIPEKSEGKLYIRPSIAGLNGGLGIIVPETSVVTVEIAAFGNYLPESIKIEGLKYINRPPSGANKIAPNYGATFKIKHDVKKRGYNDYLSFDTSGNAEEVSTCAVGFIDKEDNFIIPPIQGDIDDKDRHILPSFTRESTIDILKSKGENVIIRDVSFEEVKEMKGIFTMGNAVGVLHVSEICMRKTRKDIGQIFTMNEESIRKKIFAIRDMIYKARVGQLKGFEDWAKEII